MPALRRISKLLASFLVSCCDELMDVDLWGLFSLFVSLHIYIETELPQSEKKLVVIVFSPTSPFKIFISHLEENVEILLLFFPSHGNKPVYVMEFSS